MSGMESGAPSRASWMSVAASCCSSAFVILQAYRRQSRLVTWFRFLVLFQLTRLLPFEFLLVAGAGEAVGQGRCHMRLDIGGHQRLGRATLHHRQATLRDDLHRLADGNAHRALLLIHPG